MNYTKPSYLLVMHDALGWRTYAKHVGAALRASPDAQVESVQIAPSLTARTRYKLSSLGAKFGAYADHVQINRGAAAAAIDRSFRARPFNLVHFADHAMAGPGPGLSTPYTVALDVTGALRRTDPRFNQVSTKCVARERDIFQNASLLFPMSEWVARSLTEDYGVDPARIVVASPSLPDVPAGEPLLAKDGARKRIVFVGHDFDRKGGDLLLAAHQRHLKDDYELILIGQGAPEAGGLTGVRRLGAVENAQLRARLLPYCDVFVLPSRKDMSPFVLAEANAAGLPSVVTDVGAAPEMVDYADGRNILTSYDSDLLAERIRWVADDAARQAELGRRARALFEDRQTVEKTASRMLELFAAARRQA
ncbi:MAG: glycosyltransferase family 4 protein [Pseudomonadota bacterium]